MPNDSTREGCLSDLVFDKWNAGELGSEEVKELELHLANCDFCLRRRAALAQAADAFLSHFPTPPIPIAAERKRRHVLAPIAVALAAAAAIVLFLRVGERSSPELEHTRIKGASRLGFHVKRAEQVLTGSNAMVVHPGDQLRFDVTTLEPCHIAILSHDGAGMVTEYYPGDGQSRAVRSVRSQPLESSVELDATLGRETLYGIFCEQPFAIGPLRQTLATHGQLPSLRGCVVDTLYLEKTR